MLGEFGPFATTDGFEKEFEELAVVGKGQPRGKPPEPAGELGIAGLGREQLPKSVRLRGRPRRHDRERSCDERGVGPGEPTLQEAVLVEAHEPRVRAQRLPEPFTKHSPRFNQRLNHEPVGPARAR